MPTSILLDDDDDDDDDDVNDWGWATEQNRFYLPNESKTLLKKK